MINTGTIQGQILRDLEEGIISIHKGEVNSANPAALRIFGLNEENLLGKSWAEVFIDFMDDPVNDDLNQLILEAVYDKNSCHEAVVPFFDGKATKQLHVKTSFLHQDGETVGIIVLMRDVSELMGLRDAMKAMERIEKLNRQLELRNKALYETFGRFLSDEIVRRLVDTPGALRLGGKKQRVTVMMSDLRGFTPLTRRMEPTQLVKMLNHYLSAMTEIIERYHGTTMEFMGDGILAIFGTSMEEKGSGGGADDAVAAAVAMQSEMGAVNAWNSANGYEPLRMGIGLHTDDLIVGLIGSPKRMKYGAVGYGINLASRIESYTLDREILISEATKDACDAALGIVQSRTVFPKGSDGPLTIHQVTSIGAPHNLSYDLPHDELRALPKPVTIQLHCLDGKHVCPVAHSGLITALSPFAATMSTDADLAPMENVQLDVAGKILGKVIEQEGNAWRIAFTSTTPQFDEWYKKALGTPSHDVLEGLGDS